MKNRRSISLLAEEKKSDVCLLWNPCAVSKPHGKKMKWTYPPKESFPPACGKQVERNSSAFYVSGASKIESTK